MTRLYALISQALTWRHRQRERPRRHTPTRVAFRRPWPGTRRGLALWLFAIAFIALGGVNYICTDLPPTSRQALSFALDISGGSTIFWGVVMVVVGAVAAFSSYCHFGRDRYGFVLLSTFCVGWGLVYVCGFLFYGAGLRAFGGASVWLLMGSALACIAGFPNIALNAPPLVRDGDVEKGI